MILIFTIISFYLEALFSSFLNFQSFFCLFVLVNLVLVYPFFKDNNRYWQYCLVVGFFYDVIFMNTLFLNIGLFLLLGWLIVKINYYLINNVYSVVYIVLIIVFLYLLLSNLLLVFLGQLDFNLARIFWQFYDTILLNIIYAVIFFLILEKLSKKYQIVKIN